MTSEHELRALARRVVGRVLAERGRAEYPTAAPSGTACERTQGVHVVVTSEEDALRPKSSSGTARTPGSPSLITVADLASAPDGGRVSVPSGARVTELARDEAWRRRIALVDGPLTPAGSRRGDGRMRIALGADHGGFRMKEELREHLLEGGAIVLDFGTHDTNPVDYPDFALAVGEAVAQDRADVGVCVDGAGIGSAMAANKIPGIRAANCWDAAGAKNAREHNYANVLTLGGRTLTAQAAREIVGVFLATPWGEARHGQRVEKIRAIERVYGRTTGIPLQPRR